MQGVQTYSEDRIHVKGEILFLRPSPLFFDLLYPNEFKQFITRREVWPHLPLFQGCVTRRSQVTENPETVVNEAKLPFFYR